MGRILKTNRFDENLWDELKELSQKVDIDVSKLLDEAISLLLAKYRQSEPEPGTIKTLEFNNDVTASDLITMADAGRLFGILNSSTIPAWADKGFIKRYKNPGNLKGKSFVSKRELEQFLKERAAEPAIEGDLIPMAMACREFGFSDSYISGLALEGRIKTYPRPANIPRTVQGRTFVSRKEIREYEERKTRGKKHI